MIAVARGRGLGVLIAVWLSATLTGAPHAEQRDNPYMGADMTLYFNGGEEDHVLSSQVVLLVYLPAHGAEARDYDPAHNDIAKMAQRLSHNVAIVPLTQVWPVPDQRSRQWLRLIGCKVRSGALAGENGPLLFFSFADASGRACVTVRSSGEETAQIVEQLLAFEERSCISQAGFQTRVYDWAHKMQRAQTEGAGVIDMALLNAVLHADEVPSCDTER